MIKAEAEEAAVIANAVLAAMLSVTPTSGRAGADLRTGVGDFEANAQALIQYDQAGPPLVAIFDSARTNGVSLPQLAYVRSVAAGAEALTLGATLMKNSLIELSLATEARIIADTTFRSRNAAEAMKAEMNDAFDAMEEIAADAMASDTYRALIGLHAAVTEHLVTTQYPLPEMLNFRFAASAPTLVQAYRLYDDASRADELREENGVVHPLFALPTGQALSA